MTADAPRWLTDQEQQVWRDYLDVTRRFTDRLNRQLVEDSGMTLAEYEILVQLSEHPSRQIRMSELADLAVHSRSRLTHTVRRLESRGWVARQDCLDDRRGILCLLLDEGFAALEAAAPGHVEAVRAGLFDPLDDADVKALGVAMHKIRNAGSEQ
jgi:DNA-binding MarR family transcriptional regulator